MSRSKTSNRWLQEHFADPYVRQSKHDGYRSRASYKLLDMDHKDKLLAPGMTVVDLGAAPGGWSQVVADRVGDQGVVIASDMLPMAPLPGVTFVQGDFTETSVFEEILDALKQRPVDLVIADMAPNITGMAAIDQPRALYLVELVFAMAARVLCPGGTVVTKVFQGAGADTLLRELRISYNHLVTRKPKASRARSREMYWVAKGFKG